MILKSAADLERFLSAPPAGVRGVLLYGRDRGGVRERADRVAGAFAGKSGEAFDLDLFSDEDLDGDPGRLEAALSSYALFGGRRLARVRLTAPKAAAERALVEAAKAHEAGALNPDSLLVVEAGEQRRAAPLRTLFERAKTLYAAPVYEEDARSLSDLVRQGLAADGVSLAPDALQALIARLPRERAIARREIERLALFLGPGSGTRGTLEDLEAFFGVEPEASLRAAAADAFAGRMAECQAGLRRARAAGEGGAEAVRALSGHLARLRRAAALLSAGRTEEEVVKELNVFWKEKDEFLGQVRSWPLATLVSLSAEHLAAEQACKSSGAPDDLIAERLALSVAARARRRRA